MMIFKNAQASMPIYVFDRNTLTIEQGKITSVVPSHIDVKTTPAKMVVDLSVSANGKTNTYTIDDTLSIAFFGNSAISIDREAILREVESMKNNSEQILQDVDRHREVVKKCHQLLIDNNPQLKEKKENEERFTTIEGKLDNLAKMLEQFMK